MTKTEKAAQQKFADMADVIAEMSPLRRCLLIFAVGLVTTLAMPPAGLFFVLWGTLPFFYLTLTDAASRKQAFLRGWLFRGRILSGRAVLGDACAVCRSGGMVVDYSLGAVWHPCRFSCLYGVFGVCRFSGLEI